MAEYRIYKDDGTYETMPYEEVIHCVGGAISYRLGKALGWNVDGRVIREAAEAATHWLEASLPKEVAV